MFDQGSFQLLMDPVYGPNSKYFWPGQYLDAENYVTDPTRLPAYVSGEEFLEMYAARFSGVSDYLESTDYPEESYCDTLYDKFYSLYSHVESWDRSTLFVSAVYRELFHEMFPYQSQLCELRTELDYEYILETYLKKGLYDEAIVAAYGAPVKDSDKEKRKLSSSTWFHLMRLILYPYTDRSCILELMTVLNRTNLVATNQREIKEGLLFELEYTSTLSILREEPSKNLYRERLVWSLSLLQIEPKAAEKAVDDTLSSLSYGPIISLVQAHSSESVVVSNEASAYYLAPRYTARDYICDLVLSEEAYTRVFEKVQDSAATWGPTNLLMSFEEEGQKLAQLAFGDMIRELFHEDTSLLSIVNPAAKTLDENELNNSEQISLDKIFSNIGGKIDVPFAARKRILEICDERGIPDTEDLALEILSEAGTIHEFNKSKTDAGFKPVVMVFSLLLVYALGVFFRNKSNKQFSVNAQSYQGPSIAMEMEVKAPNETDLALETKRFADGFQTKPVLKDRFKQVPVSENVSKEITELASPLISNWGRVLGASTRQEEGETPRQTNRRRSTVASANKKVLNSQNPTLLSSESDKEKFGDIYIHETFDCTKKELTIEGSCGAAHRLEQFRQGPVKTIAQNSGWTASDVELDHHLPRRLRQGLNQNVEREIDTNIVEAIRKDIHKLLSKAGPTIYRLQKGIVSIDDCSAQILANRIDIFNDSEAKAIIAKKGRFTTQDYIDCSERASALNNKFMHLAAIQQGVPSNSIKSLLYPRQLFEDSIGKIEQVHAHLFSPQTLSLGSDLQKQEKIQNLLTSTIKDVSDNLSILANFRDSQPDLKGTTQDTCHQYFIEKLVNEYNSLINIANQMYEVSGARLTVPRLGEITLDQTISKADEKGYRYQWRTYGAKPQRDVLSSKDDLREFNKLVLTTNSLVNEPELVGVKTDVFL